MKPVAWDKVPTEKMNERINRQMINGENATLARFFLTRGAVVPRHAHTNEQYTTIVSGALQFTFDDGELVVRAGEVLPIPANVAHAAVALEDTWVLDFFAPRREDWIQKDDAYLRK
jgi:quercetin dioxygenase-like cupin family protein